MPHSHHSHSGQFCRHAKDDLEAVVQQSIRKGFTTYGLSEHAPRYRLEDFYPEEADQTPDGLRREYLAFLAEAQRLKFKHRRQITLLIGTETDYITSKDLEQTQKLLKQNPEIEYLVGSVHHVCGVAIDFDRDTWLRAVHLAQHGRVESTMILSPEGMPVMPPADPGTPQLAPDYQPSIAELRAFFEAYFDAQYELLQRFQPEVVGHIDLCFLWLPGTDLLDPIYMKLRQKVERNVKYVVNYGGLFEANSAALRKGWSTSYPGRALLRLIINCEGRICLSDDSHGVAQVGLNYVKMRNYLVDMGIEETWHLVPVSDKQKGDQQVGKRGKVVARPSRNWAEGDFWTKLAA